MMRLRSLKQKRTLSVLTFRKILNMEDRIEDRTNQAIRTTYLSKTHPFKTFATTGEQVAAHSTSTTQFGKVI